MICKERTFSYALINMVFCETSFLQVIEIKIGRHQKLSVGFIFKMFQKSKYFFFIFVPPRTEISGSPNNFNLINFNIE